MRRRRALILGSLLAVLATMSVAATVDHFWWRLPDPAEADEEGLFRWLVTRDLRHEVPGTRLVLVRRLEQYLDEGINFASVQEQLTEAQMRQVRANVELLLGDWFGLKAEEYFAETSTLQAAVIDRELDRIASWGLMELFGSSGAQNDGPSRLEVMNDLNQRAEGWIRDCPPARREQLKQFLTAVRLRVLSRAFGSWRN